MSQPVRKRIANERGVASAGRAEKAVCSVLKYKYNLFELELMKRLSELAPSEPDMEARSGSEGDWPSRISKKSRSSASSNSTNSKLITLPGGA